MIVSVLLFAQIAFASGQDPKAFPSAHCEKYEHVVHHPGYTSGVPCDTVGCPAIAVYHEAQPDECVDDTHVVTEKEWQALLKAVEDINRLAQAEARQLTGRPISK